MAYYKLDKNTKTIVRAIMKDQEKRDRRKHTGQYTAFDRRADKAIEEAKENIGLQGFTGSTRDQVIGKICQSLKDNTPWELLGETYCCRRLFYEYRKEFSGRGDPGSEILNHDGRVKDRSCQRLTKIHERESGSCNLRQIFTGV